MEAGQRPDGGRLLMIESFDFRLQKTRGAWREPSCHAVQRFHLSDELTFAVLAAIEWLGLVCLVLFLFPHTQLKRQEAASETPNLSRGAVGSSVGQRLQREKTKIAGGGSPCNSAPTSPLARTQCSGSALVVDCSCLELCGFAQTQQKGVVLVFRSSRRRKSQPRRHLLLVATLLRTQTRCRATSTCQLLENERCLTYLTVSQQMLAESLKTCRVCVMHAPSRRFLPHDHSPHSFAVEQNRV